MVPEGWEKSSLEKLIDIKHGFAFKSKHFSHDGKYIVMIPGHFNEAGGFRDQREKTKYFLGKLPDGYLLSKGELLLAMTEQAAGLLGSAAFIPESKTYLQIQRLGLVTIISPENADLEFFYWLYNSSYVRLQIANQASGTKVKHTSPTKLKGIAAFIPPFRTRNNLKR